MLWIVPGNRPRAVSVVVVVGLSIVGCGAADGGDGSRPAAPGGLGGQGAQDVQAGAGGEGLPEQLGEAGAGGASGAGAGASAGTGAATTTGASGACSFGGDVATDEVCGNGLDDDLDGFIDEGCGCSIGQAQPCFDGLPSQVSQVGCVMGTQSCEQSGEFGFWGKCIGSSCTDVEVPEICGNAADDDCDGLVDEGCLLDFAVSIPSDCVEVFCPPQAPYPVGCDLTMEGGDSRGCVANTPGASGVYFKEGDACPLPLIPTDAGNIYGTLYCASQQPASGLDATNCAVNKAEVLYPTDASGCP